MDTPRTACRNQPTSKLFSFVFKKTCLLYISALKDLYTLSKKCPFHLQTDYNHFPALPLPTFLYNGPLHLIIILRQQFTSNSIGF